ncbi:probable protein phosphatase 2C 66 isoform X2 [Amborella trichopoda]|uniref:probable protein phosphatase 2C 66 isoform X2 n=1 Tax=Amborella trichopoda TaxID=13333 RepID=UPI0009BCF0AF|nr:probable protein phosphatase 2C 66 isoform X2 [Amborella trichopoda]|eukprot:XP_020531203.1 probable protein phosphatase 2C 66 isoform X2 [Amborella trichopoda]
MRTVQGFLMYPLFFVGEWGNGLGSLMSQITYILSMQNFGSRNDTVFCGVFDGHGPYGHMVAKKVRDSLPLKLSKHWDANLGIQNGLHENGSLNGSMNSEETASIGMDEDLGDSIDADEYEKLPEIHMTLRQSFLKAFKVMDKELKLHPTIDCFCSGTTAVTLVKQGQDLVIGNVGDSRAILGTRDQDDSLIAVQLTVDLKPNLPREAERIQRCKGRVFALQDEPEVARVWLPNNDSPGLAMARAFGDFCLKDFGLISVPDISYHRITERDEFIVLATDGVWDVLTNKEVVDIVWSAPSRTTAARALVECAVRAWRLKFPTSKSDDCAVVCLFFNKPPPQSKQVEDKASSEPPLTTTTDDTAKATTPTGESNTSNLEEISERDGAWSLVPEFDHSTSVRHIEEIVPDPDRPEDLKEAKQAGRCHSTRSLAECISATEEEEWSALEGVTRVNSLLNLPRFLSGDKRSLSWRKWL